MNLNGSAEVPPFVKRVSVPVTRGESSNADALVGSSPSVRGSSVASGSSMRRRNQAERGIAPNDQVRSVSRQSSQSSEGCVPDPLQEVCVIDDECFRVPDGYRTVRHGGLMLPGTENVLDNEDQMLQFAIQKSLETQSQSETGSARQQGAEQVRFLHSLVVLFLLLTCTSFTIGREQTVSPRATTGSFLTLIWWTMICLSATTAPKEHCIVQTISL